MKDVLDVLDVLLRLSRRPIERLTGHVLRSMDVPADVAAGVEVDGPGIRCCGRKCYRAEDSGCLHLQVQTENSI
jgi:hypothetical protein